MIEADGIEAISISYTSGVVAGALAGLHPSEFSLVLLVGAAVLAINCAFHRTGSPWRLHLLLFLSGAFSFSCSNIPVYRPNLLADGLEWVKHNIAGIPFSDSKTNHLLTALLTGDKSMIDKNTLLYFRKSGAAHILALSGMHLGIIYGILCALTGPFGKSVTAFRIRSAVIIVLCTFYTVMTGAGPSLTRALIFIILREISANNRHRRRNSGKIFCTALLIQLCLSPTSIKSLSFQLSYLAMTGISFVYPILHNWFPAATKPGFKRINPAGHIWDICALSISCQIFTGPLVWFKFGIFPKYFLITNLISLPLCEAFMVCGLCCLALSSAGITFHPLIAVTELICRTLEYCLEVISGM